jgi:hypothetical protein
MKKAILLMAILIIGLVTGCFLTPASAAGTTISQVGSSARGTTTGSSLSVTTSATPTEGNVLIAVVGIRYSSGSAGISSMVQGGVDWQELQTSPISGTSGARTKVLILAGIVDSGASSAISITFSGTISAAVADVKEYNGVSTDFIENHNPDYDAYTSYSGSSTATDTRASSTTAYTNELWIAGTIARSDQSSPLNSFALTDGTTFGGSISVGYLDKIVTSTGTAQTGTTIASSGVWSAVLVTLPATSTMTLNPSHGVKGSSTSIEASGTGIAADSPITAQWDGADVTFSGSHSSDHGGSFLVTIALPPTAQAGSHSVIVTDATSNSAHATFLVTDPVSVLPESDIGISGILIAVTLAIAVWTTITRKSKKSK